MECLSYCVANQIDLAKLEKQLHSQQVYEVEQYWRVLVLINKEEKAYCYAFSNGTLVFWNIKRPQISAYLELIYPACVNKLSKPLFDGYYYRIGDVTTIRPHGFYNLDCVILESEESDLKLSLSYGFSQSIKLRYFEARIEKLNEKYMPYVTQLSQHGKFKLTRSGMRGVIGHILLVKGELNITGSFSYQPKFFWKHPNLENYYTMLEKYLDIVERTEALNQQLNTLNEIFLMFHSYLEDNHAHNLEVVIIVLIAIEIVFGVLNLHF